LGVDVLAYEAAAHLQQIASLLRPLRPLLGRKRNERSDDHGEDYAADEARYVEPYPTTCCGFGRFYAHAHRISIRRGGAMALVIVTGNVLDHMNVAIDPARRPEFGFRPEKSSLKTGGLA